MTQLFKTEKNTVINIYFTYQFRDYNLDTGSIGNQFYDSPIIYSNII